MSIICITSLNQIKNKNKPIKRQQNFKIKKNNNNLVCPNCGVHIDRSNVKYWLEYNHGECPCCFKTVKFESVHPRGPRGGREYYNSENTNNDKNITSSKIKFFEKFLEENGFENPLKYLKTEEIALFADELMDIVIIDCGKNWPIGRPTKEFQEKRKKILEFMGN